MILSSQEPTEVQLSKLKSKLYRKNLKCIVVISFPKILCMHFLTVQLNRTLIKKNQKHEGYAKVHKISGNLTVQSLFSH